MPHEQRTLQGQRHALGEIASTGLARVAEFLAQPDNRLIQPAVGSSSQIELGEEGLG